MSRRDIIGPIKDILAMFAAMRNYGYLDIIGNALERTTALEAMGNAIRDFRSMCLDASEDARKRLEEEEGIKCPDISPENLEKAASEFMRVLEEKEKSGELVLFLREIYVDALSRASIFKVKTEAKT